MFIYYLEEIQSLKGYGECKNGDVQVVAMPCSVRHRRAGPSAYGPAVRSCPSFSKCGLSLGSEEDAFLIFTCHTFLLHIFLMDGPLKY
jgi:hypothetical protein